jgi:hypothetical protein
MQGNQQMIGSFRLLVSKDGSPEWGELRIIKYDERSENKSNHRDNVLKEISAVRDRWFTNYKPFQSADFRIVEQSIEMFAPVIISGPK